MNNQNLLIDSMGLNPEDAHQIQEGSPGTDLLLLGDETPLQRLLRERNDEIICEKISSEENREDDII